MAFPRQKSVCMPLQNMQFFLEGEGTTSGMSLLWIFILVSMIMQGLHKSNLAIKFVCSILVSCCAKLGTNYIFRKTDNCSGRLIGVPENCYGRLISILRDLLTTPEHLLTAPEHLLNGGLVNLLL